MKLSNLYRKWLRGSDIIKPVDVEILGIQVVQVQPDYNEAPQDKYCLLVTGLPDDLPGAVLMGPEMVANLVKVIGDLDTKELPGKRVKLVSKSMKVGGRQLLGIRFATASKESSPAANTPPPPDEPEDDPLILPGDDIPF